MSIRLLKLRAWLKTRTNMFLRAARAPVLTVVVTPEPHAFDAWVCHHVNPETLYADTDSCATQALARFAALTNAPDLFDDPTPSLRRAGLL